MSDRDAYRNSSNNEQPGSSNGSGSGFFNGSHHFGINGASFYDFQNFHYHAGDLQNSIQEQNLEKLRDTAWMGAVHDSAERFPPPKCEPGTRDDVLKSLKEWTGGYLPSSQYRITWAHGSEFSGKSAIAQTLAEHLQRYQKLGASFFFPDDTNEQNLIRSFIPTIVYQLCQNVPGPVLRGGIVRALNEDATILSKALDVQIKKLLLQPLKDLQAPLNSDLLIIVDGLDKCESKAAQKGIILSLARAALEDRRLRFIIFSRPEQHLYDSFHNHELVGVYMSIDLDKSYSVEHSIRKYLRAGFTSIYTARKSVMKRIQLPWPPEVYLDVLVDKSSRHFCCAAAILRIAGAGSVNPIDQLDRLLDMEPQELDPHLKPTSPRRIVSPPAPSRPQQNTPTYQQVGEHYHHPPAYNVHPSDIYTSPSLLYPWANFNTAQFVNSQIGGIYPGSSASPLTPVAPSQTQVNDNLYNKFIFSQFPQAEYQFGVVPTDIIDSMFEPYIQDITTWQNERRFNSDSSRDAAKIEELKGIAKSTLDQYRPTVVGVQSILPMRKKVDALNRADAELLKAEPDWMAVIGLIKVIMS